jgi:chromosome segregation ATPase
MRRDRVLRLTALFALVGFSTALPTLAQQSPDQQSSDAVADAARKARTEKQATPKPKKIYTDDDFASTKHPAAQGPKAEGAAPSATTDQAVNDQSAAKDGSASNDPKSEAFWRKRFQTLRDKLDQSEKELDILQRELNKDQLQYYNDPQKALMQQYDRKDINEKTSKIDARKKEIEDLKKKLSDMEDELRKAGGDPGWAR